MSRRKYPEKKVSQIKPTNNKLEVKPRALDSSMTCSIKCSMISDTPLSPNNIEESLLQLINYETFLFNLCQIILAIEESIALPKSLLSLSWFSKNLLNIQYERDAKQDAETAKNIFLEEKKRYEDNLNKHQRQYVEAMRGLSDNESLLNTVKNDLNSFNLNKTLEKLIVNIHFIIFFLDKKDTNDTLAEQITNLEYIKQLMLSIIAKQQIPPFLLEKIDPDSCKTLAKKGFIEKIQYTKLEQIGNKQIRSYIPGSGAPRSLWQQLKQDVRFILEYDNRLSHDKNKPRLFANLLKPTIFSQVLPLNNEQAVKKTTKDITEGIEELTGDQLLAIAEHRIPENQYTLDERKILAPLINMIQNTISKLTFINLETVNSNKAKVVKSEKQTSNRQPSLAEPEIININVQSKEIPPQQEKTHSVNKPLAEAKAKPQTKKVESEVQTKPFLTSEKKKIPPMPPTLSRLNAPTPNKKGPTIFSGEAKPTFLDQIVKGVELKSIEQRAATIRKQQNEQKRRQTINLENLLKNAMRERRMMLTITETADIEEDDREDEWKTLMNTLTISLDQKVTSSTITKENMQLIEAAVNAPVKEIGVLFNYILEKKCVHLVDKFCEELLKNKNNVSLLSKVSKSITNWLDVTTENTDKKINISDWLNLNARINELRCTIVITAAAENPCEGINLLIDYVLENDATRLFGNFIDKISVLAEQNKLDASYFDDCNVSIKEWLNNNDAKLKNREANVQKSLNSKIETLITELERVKAEKVSTPAFRR